MLVECHFSYSPKVQGKLLDIEVVTDGPDEPSKNVNSESLSESGTVQK